MKTLKRFIKNHIPVKLLYFFRYFLAMPQFFGFEFKCPLCGYWFRKLRPYGMAMRPNALCPVCTSLERHRLLYLFFKNKTNLFSSQKKVLHFAPEACLSLILRSKKNIFYITADLASPKVMINMDLTKISIPDNTFDVILCSHVLEHVLDDRKAMTEIYRILKPGGWALLQVPIEEDREHTLEDPSVVTPEDRLRVFGQTDHVRIYGRDYRDRVKQVGFELVEDWYVRSFKETDIIRYCMQPDRAIFIAKKSI